MPTQGWELLRQQLQADMHQLLQELERVTWIHFESSFGSAEGVKGVLSSIPEGERVNKCF